MIPLLLCRYYYPLAIDVDIMIAQPDGFGYSHGIKVRVYFATCQSIYNDVSAISFPGAANISFKRISSLISGIFD